MEAGDGLKAAKEAKEIYAKLKDTSAAAEASRAVALAYYASGLTTQGLDYAATELATASKSGDQTAQALMLLAVAEGKLVRRLPGDALENALNAADIFQVVGEAAWEAKAKSVEIEARLAKGQTQTALDTANSLLELCHKEEDKKGEAAAHSQKALIYMAKRDQQQEAMKELESSLALYQETGDKAEQSAILRSMATVEKSRSNFEKALRFGEKSLKVAKDASSQEACSQALDALVKVCGAMGEPEEGVKRVKQEQNVCWNEGDTRGEVGALEVLIQAQLAANNPEGSLHAAGRALKRAIEAEDTAAQARMLYFAASLYYRNEQYDKALKSAKEALTLVPKDVEEGQGMRAALNSLVAESHAARGEEPPATQARADALQALEDVGKALEGKKVDDFKAALAKLQSTGGYTSQESQQYLAGAFDKDRKAAQDFLGDNLPAGLGLESDGVKKYKVSCLRQFPVEPAEGGSGDVQWMQTLGKITLSYVLPSVKAENEILVELSQYDLTVTISGKKVQDLSGHLFGEVRHGHSWWSLHKAPGKSQNLVIQLVKQQSKAWKSPWFTAQGLKLHPSRGAYIWNEVQQERVSEESRESVWQGNMQVQWRPTLDPTEEELALWRPRENKGRFAPKSDNFVCYPDDVVVGIDAKQDTNSITIRCFFEAEMLEYMQEKAPLEELLACDVVDDQVTVFLHGDDQNPIFMAELWGLCLPDETTWKMASSEAYRHRQNRLDLPCPALVVTIQKSPKTKGMWSKPFREFWQHELMVKNWDEVEEARQIVDSAEAWAEDGELDEEQQRYVEEARARLDSWRPERWEGYPGGKTYMRMGKDFQDPHYWDNVEQFVEQAVDRQGTEGGAKWNPKLKRFSYLDN